MPSWLAAVLTTALAIFMIASERRSAKESSAALWLPVIWLFVAGSRFVSQWLDLGSPGVTENVADSSSLDAAFFLFLIAAGLMVLARRDIAWRQLVRANLWIVAFFAFSFLAILWSDFQFIAFKRWVKTLGHPVMALIILTDPDPRNALKLVLRRCAYLFLPFSILFIKYFPQYGRGFDSFTGRAFNNGISLTKNDLGYVCMVIGLYSVWGILQGRQLTDATQRRREWLVGVALLAMVGWLLNSANSATSLGALAVGVVTTFVLGTRMVDKRYVGRYVAVGLVAVVAMQAVFDLYGGAISVLGRDEGLTDRTAVWIDAIALQERPLIGAGFESFWLGSRLDAMWAKWWWRPNQAHNGYLETYLNLGWIGVVLLVAMILATFRKITTRLVDDFEFGRLRLAFLFAILVFNYTEASFKAVHFLWTMFYIIALECPKRSQTKQVRGHRTFSPPVSTVGVCKPNGMTRWR